MAIGVVFNYFVIFENARPSFMGLLLLQPAWGLLSYCVAVAVLSRGRDHAISVCRDKAVCKLTRCGVLFSSSRTIPFSSIRRFRVVTKRIPALNHEESDSGTNAFGIEVVCLGPRLVFGFVLDKTACQALVEQFQLILDDAHKNGKECSPPPSLFQSLCEYEKSVSVVDDTAALTSRLPQGSLVRCRRHCRSGHVSIVLQSPFPRQTAMATVLVNVEWYVTLAISLVKAGTKVSDVARNGFVIVGSVISAVAMVVVFGTALVAENWTLGKEDVRHWRRFCVFPHVINVAKVERVEVFRTRRRSVDKMAEDESGVEDCIGGRRFGVRLVGDKELAELEMLTEGEVLFIAGEFRKRYGDTYSELFEENEVV